MGAIEIIILVFATAFVAAVITVSAVNKTKRKKSGCRTCAGCPYASSCASVHTGRNLREKKGGDAPQPDNSRE